MEDIIRYLTINAPLKEFVNINLLGKIVLQLMLRSNICKCINITVRNVISIEQIIKIILNVMNVNIVKVRLYYDMN